MSFSVLCCMQETKPGRTRERTSERLPRLCERTVCISELANWRYKVSEPEMSIRFFWGSFWGCRGTSNFVNLRLCLESPRWFLQWAVSWELFCSFKVIRYKQKSFAVTHTMHVVYSSVYLHMQSQLANIVITIAVTHTMHVMYSSVYLRMQSQLTNIVITMDTQP